MDIGIFGHGSQLCCSRVAIVWLVMIMFIRGHEYMISLVLFDFWSQMKEDA